ncbi:MAG: hypothetical protein KJ950_02380 [Proteobacteria bacterium]|nr:hypothetical protein [Pseudomonadota bacterium]MBU1686694.1 hypothetical protein [Pseudomonadota bacterium]
MDGVKDRTDNRNRVEVSSRTDSDAVSRGSLITMGVVSGLVGIWAVACLFSAMASSGGPIALFKSWFTAIVGM